MPTANDILIGYLASTSKRLQEMMLNPSGKGDRARAFNVSRAAVLISHVRDLQRELKAQIAAVTGPMIAQAYRNGLRQGNQQAIESGAYRPNDPLLRGGFSLIDRQAAAVVARDTAADLFKAADAMADNAVRLLRRTAENGLSNAQINEVIARGILEGSPAEVTRALRDELRRVHDGNIVPIIDKNGDLRHFDAGSYAKLIVITKTREAVVTARHERLMGLNLDVVTIIGKLSNNFCSAFLGQAFSLSGKSRDYPPLASLPGGGPPFHVQCSKGTRAFVAELASGAQREVAQGVVDAQKLLGMDTSAAQRAFKDLQLRAQVRQAYGRIVKIAA